jgi:DNA polymerase epsilon subunit 3
MPRANQAAVAASSAQAQQDAMVEAEGIDHYELPKALVTRIAKSAVSTPQLELSVPSSKRAV